MTWVQDTPQGAVIHILVQPRASRTQVVGPHGDPVRLKIRIAAPPVDGAANEELLRFLKKCLELSAKSLELIRGEGARQKDVLCFGKSAAEVREKLSPLISQNV